ncbi:MAG: NAD(P)H-hydrate dehydratase [Bavariicoccus seileri]|uniref:ADP-dependent (S)-NAD(P)H-hydrate dehydratase n=1 Tax=Bavariicoccus seileri TaxID=549685 RepID=A0A3D4S4G2_9ENTE|nr:NAD(P)H-hydrate dehydratase [Bavariicoccus seileri]HCS93694.1 NAD(P)H-hydrate dehydratase [Bavariicoccus seileri]
MLIDRDYNLALAKRPENSHKGTFGKVLLIGGNFEMAGAIIMASLAAISSGAGLVTVATDARNFSAIHTHTPEVMCVDWDEKKMFTDLLKSVDTVFIGSGLGRNKKAERLFTDTLEIVTKKQFLVLDADALFFLSHNTQLPITAKSVILTPHQGEWSRLSGLEPSLQTHKSNLQSFRSFILNHQLEDTDTLLVLKKHHTDVYGSLNHHFEHIAHLDIGNPAMATGGMGDTLSGIISALVYQSKSIEHAILDSLFIHSMIGDQLAKSNYVVRPTLISQHIPKFITDNLIVSK